ncbi:hypothetical protein KY290_027870 [Solanum tuberosum]|uniref:Uncharacterized protein n=1 Tax=Solanum tuberosum TaxID=4113 RepID=A0ABQ7UGB7_SOLTU|nr:hypothetical protein KY290_027870 [Solanum tuberosum]
MSRENGIKTVIGPGMFVREIIDGGGEVVSGVEDLTAVRGDDNTIRICTTEAKFRITNLTCRLNYIT